MPWVALNAGIANYCTSNMTDTDTLTQQIADLQARVAQLTESATEREARELREEAAEHAAILAANATRRLESEPVKQHVLACVKARSASATAVDKAGDALVRALQAMRDQSQPIALDVQSVICARHDGVAAASHAGLALPHAYGASSYFAAGLADIAKRCVAVIGVDAMSDLIVMNSFATTTGATFAKANASALEQLEARL